MPDPVYYFLQFENSCPREWLSGGVSPCQGEGRGFESRLALYFFAIFSGASQDCCILGRRRFCYFTGNGVPCEIKLILRAEFRKNLTAENRVACSGEFCYNNETGTVVRGKYGNRDCLAEWNEKEEQWFILLLFWKG